MTHISDSEGAQMLVSLGWSELHYAAEKQDLQYAKELLQKDGTLNVYDRVGRTPLTIAASKGNMEFVRWLLEKGAEVNSGFPLHYATEKGHSDITKFLIKNGADVNLVKDNNYPLIIAAANGHLEIAKILIQNGANIKAINETNATALHMACLYGCPDLLTLLIDSGCDINAEDRFNNNPIQTCLIFNGDKPELVKILVDKGAHIDGVDCQKKTLLHDCDNPVTTLELIRCGVNINARDIRGETPLFSMVETDYTECAKVLLEHNADPNIPAYGGMTPLHLAAKCGNVELVKELLQKNASVNAANAQNVIPLHLAAKENHVLVVKVLLENGSLIDVTTIDLKHVNSHSICLDGGETPLSLAKSRKHDAVAQLLNSCNDSPNSTLETGVIKKTPADNKNLDSVSENFLPELCNDIIALVKANDLQSISHLQSNDICLTAKDSIGWTLLHHSVANGTYEISSELILKGSSVNALDHYERTPLSIAAFRNDTKAIQLLIESGADVNLGLALHYAMHSDAMEAILELIKFSCDINIKDKTFWGHSALTEAAAEGKSPVVKVLLENGANPNDVNKLRETALHNSCQFDDIDSVRLLIKHGAKINSSDNCKDIPLTCAVLNSTYEVVQILLDNGADVHWKDSSLWTPLHRAASKGDAKITSELVKAGADVNYFNYNVESPLYLATRNPKIVKLLLDNNADVNFDAFGGWSSLHESVYEGSLKSVQELLDHGANINVGSAENVLPIYLASIGQHIDIVEELLKRGSYVNPRILDVGVIRTEHFYFSMNKSRHIVTGNTPFIGASAKGRLEVMKLLHSYGADLNAANVDGNTALHEAVLGGFGDIVKFLVDLNVNLHAKNINQKSALDLAKEHNKDEIVNMLDK